MNKKIISFILKIIFSVVLLSLLFIFITGGFSGSSSESTSPPAFYTVSNNPDNFLFGAFEKNVIIYITKI